MDHVVQNSFLSSFLSHIDLSFINYLRDLYTHISKTISLYLGGSAIYKLFNILSQCCIMEIFLGKFLRRTYSFSYWLVFSYIDVPQSMYTNTYGHSEITNILLRSVWFFHVFFYLFVYNSHSLHKLISGIYRVSLNLFWNTCQIFPISLFF